jgi:undecaprenyl diphosphate synthase
MAATTNGESYSNGKQQQQQQQPSDVPRHVALVCDGNSRWARARRLPTSVGHFAGADRLIDSIQILKRAGVQVITYYGFSTENWKRSPTEISSVLRVMELTARQFYYKEAFDNNVRIKILGDLQDERIPNGLRDILSKLERDTSCQNGVVTVCIAVNYGGRQDIVNASLRLAKAISCGQIDEDNVTEEDFGSFLCTLDIPDPDLIIRTGGEKRLSNFLLWNSAYSELYFSDVLWPDFDETCVLEALSWFATRSRRFGGRKSQVTSGGI